MVYYKFFAIKEGKMHKFTLFNQMLLWITKSKLQTHPTSFTLVNLENMLGRTYK